MIKKERKGLNQVLAEMAEDMVYAQDCTWLWGEEELPECLKEQKRETKENEF